MAVVSVVIALCAGLLVLKGWWLLILAPASVVYFPLMAWQQHRVRVRKTTPVWVKRVAHAQVWGTLLFFLCLPALGDTAGTFVLGFVATPDDSTLARSCTVVAAAGLCVALATSLCLLVTAAVERLRGRREA